jgi:hypothetical protein
LCFLAFLRHFFFGFAWLLLALGFEVVGQDVVTVVPAEDAERTGQEATEGATPGTGTTERAGQGIETRAVHGCTPRCAVTKSSRTDQSAILAPGALCGNPQK